MKNKFLRLFCHFTLLIIFFVFSEYQVNAALLFEDDFDDGVIDDWTETRSMQWQNPSSPCLKDGIKANWSVTAGKIGISLYGPSCVTEIIPSSFQISSNESYIYEFDMDFPRTIEADRNFVIKYQNGDNWYGVHIFNNEVFFQKVISGKGYGLSGDYTQYNFLPDQTYHFRNEISNEGKITIFVDGNILFELQDEEPFLSGGKIGLQASTGSISSSEVFFDNVKVSTIDPLPTPEPTEPPVETKELAVPYISQKKPWGSEEYDQASQYSWANPPTIGRWGCALASMAMVLQFHGIANLPDGQPLNPSTLNTWLKSQPDGYLAEANLNWNAVTRLTRLIAESNQAATPLLEYQWQPQNNDFLKAEIQNNRPVILKTDNHFVTARGYVGDIFSIHDSYWPMKYTLAEYNNTYQNMRVFTPTNSDLSYLIFVTPAGNSLALKNTADNTQVPMISYQEGGLADPSDSTHQQSTRKVTQLAKPESGNYLVELSGEPVASSSATVYVYDKTGNVQIFSMSKENNEPAEFELKYQKEGVSSFTLIEDEEEVPHDFDTFSKLVKSYWQQHEIKKQYVTVYLLTLSQLGQKLKTRQAKFFMTELIESVVSHLSKKEISPTAKQGLLEEIRLVQTKYSNK